MKVKRNDPCPCGSNRKYKNCCAQLAPIKSAKQKSNHIHSPSPNTSVSKGQVLRTCDGCSECCTTLTINNPELVLGPGERCSHQCPAGCDIHNQHRPSICSAYHCNYLLEPGNLSESERPDKVGAIIRRVKNDAVQSVHKQVLYFNECRPGGLKRTLENCFWGPIIEESILYGVAIYASFIGDPYNREIIHLRFHDKRLGCELTCCHQDASPVLTIKEPVYYKKIESALMIPNQGFAFDAEVLLRQFGHQQETVIGPSKHNSDATSLRFLFTHRQAELVKNFLNIIKKSESNRTSIPVQEIPQHVSS